jgi:hypothetical protein
MLVTESGCGRALCGVNLARKKNRVTTEEDKTEESVTLKPDSLRQVIVWVKNVAPGCDQNRRFGVLHADEKYESGPKLDANWHVFAA